MLGLYKAVFTFVFLLLSCVLKETLVEFLAHCMMTHCFSSTFDQPERETCPGKQWHSDTVGGKQRAQGGGKEIRKRKPFSLWHDLSK